MSYQVLLVLRVCHKYANIYTNDFSLKLNILIVRSNANAYAFVNADVLLHKEWADVCIQKYCEEYVPSYCSASTLFYSNNDTHYREPMCQSARARNLNYISHEEQIQSIVQVSCR